MLTFDQIVRTINQILPTDYWLASEPAGGIKQASTTPRLDSWKDRADTLAVDLGIDLNAARSRQRLEDQAATRGIRETEVWRMIYENLVGVDKALQVMHQVPSVSKGLGLGKKLGEHWDWLVPPAKAASVVCLHWLDQGLCDDDHLELLKSAVRRPEGDLERIPEDVDLDWVLKEHGAQVAGPHHDLRFGNPDLGLYSWAVRRGLPEGDEKRLAVRQPLHNHRGMNWEGEIPKGRYGAGPVKRIAGGKGRVRQEAKTIILDTEQGIYRLTPKGGTWLLSRG